MTPRRVLIGIGNRLRGDDGVGPALVADFAANASSDVELRVSSGDPFDLITAWTGADRVVVVDAAHTGRAVPGTVHRWDAGLGAATTNAGTHGIGLAEAVAISNALGRTPHALVILAVEVAEVGFGTVLSPEVARALPELRRVAELLLNE